MFINNSSIEDNDDIKLALTAAGLLNFYEQKQVLRYYGASEVQFKLKKTAKGVSVKLLQPQIGNDVQVLVTIILVVSLCSFSMKDKIPLWVLIIAAIISGQIIAYVFYSIKLSSLKTHLSHALERYESA